MDGHQLKTNFELLRTIQPIYLGGYAIPSPDEKYLISSLGEEIHVMDLESGLTKASLKGDAGDVTCFAVKPNGQHVIAAYRSLMFKCFDLSDGTVVRTWKGHEAPVLTMAFDPTSTLVATGSADSTVKVWDADKGHATHNFRGHSGVISAVTFSGVTQKTKSGKRMLLASASEDCKVKVWDLVSKTLVATLESHISVVRSLAFFGNGDRLVSGGRDSVINVWNLQELSGEVTIPTFEPVEALVLIEPTSFGKNHHFRNESLPIACTGGEKGVLKFWNLETGECMMTQERLPSSKYEILSISLMKASRQIVIVTSDHNFLFCDLDSDLVPSREVIGYNEEVIDIAFVNSEQSQVAVATNSEQIRVYSLEDSDSQLLSGHEETVLCVDSSKDGKYLISGSKDNTAIVWAYDEESKKLSLFGTCAGHTEAVSAVSFAKKSSSFVLTGSEDRTVKLWDLETSKKSISHDNKLKARFTFQAHDKDINSIAVAPNDKIFATGSQDKTAKIWSCADGSLVGEFRGHRRGVWCVTFSPVDQVLATASADKTIKLWSLADSSCLKTFEGHLNSVLKVSFLSLGTQLLSSGSDGLLKLWTIKSNECINTFDNHEDKIWALVVKRDESLVVTGAADAKINLWKDCTTEDEEKESKENEDRVAKEQDLANCIFRKDFKNAFSLAMELDQPFRLFSMLRDLKKFPQDKNSETGSKAIDQAIISMDIEKVRVFTICPHGLTISASSFCYRLQSEQLLLYIRDWNTNAKFAPIAHTMLHLILRNHSASSLLQLPRIKELLDGLIAYTTRHLNSTEELLKRTYVMDYVLDRMVDMVGATDMDIGE
ncbi:Transducin (beta)-like 3 [Phlyctochytrium planicorne]|nr:Transducin (beta)-like 3 [Phlyctochytrium planicorne]